MRLPRHERLLVQAEVRSAERTAPSNGVSLLLALGPFGPLRFNLSLATNTTATVRLTRLTPTNLTDLEPAESVDMVSSADDHFALIFPTDTNTELDTSVEVMIEFERPTEPVGVQFCHVCIVRATSSLDCPVDLQASRSVEVGSTTDRCLVRPTIVNANASVDVKDRQLVRHLFVYFGYPNRRRKLHLFVYRPSRANLRPVVKGLIGLFTQPHKPIVCSTRPLGVRGSLHQFGHQPQPEHVVWQMRSSRLTAGRITTPSRLLDPATLVSTEAKTGLEPGSASQDVVFHFAPQADQQDWRPVAWPSWVCLVCQLVYSPTSRVASPEVCVNWTQSLHIRQRPSNFPTPQLRLQPDHKHKFAHFAQLAQVDRLVHHLLTGTIHTFVCRLPVTLEADRSTSISFHFWPNTNTNTSVNIDADANANVDITWVGDSRLTRRDNASHLVAELTTSLPPTVGGQLVCSTPDAISDRLHLVPVAMQPIRLKSLGQATPIQIEPDPQTATATETATATYICQADGWPPATVVWRVMASPEAGLRQDGLIMETCEWRNDQPTLRLETAGQRQATNCSLSPWQLNSFLEGWRRERMEAEDDTSKKAQMMIRCTAENGFTRAELDFSVLPTAWQPVGLETSGLRPTVIWLIPGLLVLAFGLVVGAATMLGGLRREVDRIGLHQVANSLYLKHPGTTGWEKKTWGSLPLAPRPLGPLGAPATSTSSGVPRLLGSAGSEAGRLGATEALPTMWTRFQGVAELNANQRNQRDRSVSQNKKLGNSPFFATHTHTHPRKAN
ncbi:unnamed protein product [Protopolystoma xenopodis]|uniref:Ig-like domain-containing protein n=1 Tax=Protopolystoma xenopodis TaxID=117903 RepID=A0A3S5BCB2_9PLAT|nr:unnamed protein product [Protopolystoma xenopodis]